MSCFGVEGNSKKSLPLNGIAWDRFGFIHATRTTELWTNVECQAKEVEQRNKSVLNTQIGIPAQTRSARLLRNQIKLSESTFNDYEASDPSIVRCSADEFWFQTTNIRSLFVKVGGQMKSLMRLIGGLFIFRSFRLMSQAVSGSSILRSSDGCCGFCKLTIAKSKSLNDHANHVSNLIDYFEIWDSNGQQSHQSNGPFDFEQTRPHRCLISLGPGTLKNNQFNVSDVSRARSGVIDSVCRALCLAVIQPTTEKSFILFQSLAVVIYSISRFQIAFSSSFWLLWCWSLVFYYYFFNFNPAQTKSISVGNYTRSD